MSLFSQLVQEVADQKNHKLADVLLKAKVLASQLRSRKFRQWIDAEINGYGDKAELPEYRVIPSKLVGEFGGYYGSQVSTPLSVSHLEPNLRDLLSTHHEFNGVSYIEDLLTPSEGPIGTYLDGSIVNYLRQHGTQISGMILNRVFKQISHHSYQQLLNSVRSSFLDFLLELRETYPELDKSDEAAGHISGADIDEVVEKKVYHHCTFIEGKEMRDVYQTAQAGAVGPGAKAENMTFIQILRQAIGESSLADLANDLERLRSTMVTESKTAEQDASVAAVAEAEYAAKKGDAQGVLGWLKKAGKWSFDVATKIGSAVAAKAIEVSLGL